MINQGVMQRPELLLHVKAAAVALVSFYWYLLGFCDMCTSQKNMRKEGFFCFQVLGGDPEIRKICGELFAVKP